jgi:hypothetical protein
MGRRVARGILFAGIMAVVAAGVAYVASPTEIRDLRLVSVDATRLADIKELKGEALPNTPVFRVRFSTSTDLVAVANEPDAYTVRTRVLVGDAGCNPGLKTITYTRVAFMLLDFTRVYDEEGNVEGRGVWSSRADDGSNEYTFYFGVVPSEIQEFVSSGLREAPLCFELAGESRVGKSLSSNLVLLPADTLAEAASQLKSS